MVKAEKNIELFSAVFERSVEAAVSDRLAAIESKIEGLTKLLTCFLTRAEDEVMLNKKEACELLGITYPTLRAYIKRGTLTPSLNGQFRKSEIITRQAKPLKIRK